MASPYQLGCLLAWCLAPLALLAQTRPALTLAQYQQDYAYFWTTVRDDYAYFNKKQTDWERVRQHADSVLPAVVTRDHLVRLLESSLAELYDSHAGLGTNLPDSRRMVPSGTDVWAEFGPAGAVVTSVRPGFGAERAGLRPGMIVLAVNNVPLEAAIRPLLPHYLKAPDPAARQLALNLALAGDHRTPRKFTVQERGHRQDVYPDRDGMRLETNRSSQLLDVRHYGGVAYLKINNSLGNNALIAAFDSVLTAQGTPAGLILDLRDTPNGGNTVVARAIMSRFITREQPYQRHEQPAEEAAYGVRRSWLELVSPRPAPYLGPLVLLVGRWTASMGEGITIGFDAMQRATIMGTEMARLNGSVATYHLPHSGIKFNIPTERLYQVNGQLRETYVPPVHIQPPPGTADAALAAALQQLQASAKP